MPLVPCEKCGHPRPTEGIGDGEIGALLRERDRDREAMKEALALAAGDSDAESTMPAIESILTKRLKG